MNKSESKDVLKASYMPQSKAAAYLQKTQGYSYDPQLSSMQQKVFLNRDGKPVITQRGSTRLSDWLIEDVVFKFPGLVNENQDYIKKV